MRCPHSDLEAQAYFDGELSAGENLHFETHLSSCSDCRDVLARNGRLREMLANGSLYFPAPADLRVRLGSLIGDSPSTSATLSNDRPWRLFAISSVLAAAACVALLLTLLPGRTGQDDLIAQEIVASHIRAMMASHLLDVPSLDRHTVKPWFDGKLDFAPPVIDTTAQGFPLIGGRLDYISSRPVAALVYKRDQHVINLFVWTSGQPADETGRVLSRQGYNMVRWNRAGMTFWAVSDLELTQLQLFAQAQQSSG